MSKVKHADESEVQLVGTCLKISLSDQDIDRLYYGDAIYVDNYKEPADVILIYPQYIRRKKRVVEEKQ